jgi:hypothetical protein
MGGFDFTPQWVKVEGDPIAIGWKLRILPSPSKASKKSIIANIILKSRMNR